MVLQNRRNRFGKSSDGKLRLLSQQFAITAIDENRAAASRVRAINIAPTVAN